MGLRSFLAILVVTVCVFGNAASDEDSEATARSLVAVEVLRLQRCPDVSELVPPPIHMMVRWLTPSQVELVSFSRLKNGRGKYRAVVQYAIRYEQSDFFDTEEEAKKAEQFRTNFMTLQRNTYVISSDRLTHERRESFLENKWEVQKTPIAKFACWASNSNPIPR